MLQPASHMPWPGVLPSSAGAFLLFGPLTVWLVPVGLGSRGSLNHKGLRREGPLRRFSARALLVQGHFALECDDV